MITEKFTVLVLLIFLCMISFFFSLHAKEFRYKHYTFRRKQRLVSNLPKIIMSGIHKALNILFVLSLSLYFTAYVQLMGRAVFLICISREGFDLVQDPGCKKMELIGLFHNKIIKTFLSIINKQIRMYNKNSSD